MRYCLDISKYVLSQTPSFASCSVFLLGPEVAAAVSQESKRGSGTGEAEAVEERGPAMLRNKIR